MTDILTRLADALQGELDEHGHEDDDEKRWQVAYHIADVLLSLPGIAIVELPERLPEDVAGKMPLGNVSEIIIRIDHHGWVRLNSQFLQCYESTARLAARLLAAANTAEQAGGG
jgi:hypothetical protein